MKELVNERFVNQILSFLINSAIMLDLDQKRRLVEIFFEFNKSPIKMKRRFEKEQKQFGKPVAVSLKAIHRLIAKWKKDRGVVPSTP